MMLNQPRGTPKISLVTPSFNQARFVERTICSIIDQGYPELEYLVMDGGSTDGSAEIIRRHADRMTYWQSGPDGGQSAAIQAGFERATGDILGWVNSDDVLLPGALRRVAEFFTNRPDCELLIGNSVRIDDQDNAVKRVWAYPLDYQRILYWGTGFDQPASFWRRSLFFEAGGLDTALQFCFDYDLYLRMAKRSPVYRCNVFLAALRLHAGSKTARLQHVQLAESQRIRQAHGYYDASHLYRWGFRLLHGSGFKLLQLFKRLLTPSKVDTEG
jgi:glycosyltransferase involved in cell wall biosynthesis